LDCGASYLLSAVAALESVTAIEYDSNIVELSTQHTLECVKNMTGAQPVNCKEDKPEIIWKYAKDQGGLVVKSAYQSYTGNTRQSCVSSLRKDPNSSIDTWSRIPQGDEELMKCRLARHGPVVASIKIRGTDLLSYKSGIYDDATGACASSKSVDQVI
jgi:hypothetical protein